MSRRSPAIPCAGLALLTAIVCHPGCTKDETPPGPGSTAQAPSSAPDLPPYATLQLARSGVEPTVAAEIERLDPAHDGWPEEVFAAAARQVLDRLTTDLGAGVIPRDAPDDLVVRYPDPLAPGAPSSSGIRVASWRAEPDQILQEIEGPAGLVALVDQAGVATEPFIEFEMTSALMDESTVEATLLVKIAGQPGTDGTVTELNGTWQTRWAWSEPNAASLQSITVTRLDRIDTPRVLLTDCTADVIGRNDAYAEQLVHGAEHWQDHLDRFVGFDPTGRNGLAIGDIDGDGLDDLFVSQNAGLPNLLFKAYPDGTAREIGADAGVDFLDFTSGALIVDLDNDGDQDLVLAMGRRLLVMSNDGRGRFVIGARLDAPGNANIYMIVAADYDNDGDLDLYACRFNSTVATDGMSSPIPYHDAENGPSNVLWRNDGDRRFTDVTLDVGLDVNNRRYSFAAGWEDFDLDGDQDLYVANDFGRNNLYRNDGGTFTDIAADAGAEDMAAGMGVSWADADLDGDLDVYISNMYSDHGMRMTELDRYKTDASGDVKSAYRRHARGNTLLLNNGDGTFTDGTEHAGVARGHWAWGAVFTDLDNDGLDDLLVPNGYVSRAGAAEDLQNYFWRRVVNSSPLDPDAAVDEYFKCWSALGTRLHLGASWAGFERNVAYLNAGDSQFVDISHSAGFDYDDDARALGLVDWDGDGDQDAWVANRTAPQLRFLRNNTDDGSFVTFRLTGDTCNRDAIGARVEIDLGGRTLMRSVHAGSGFLAQSSKTVHFGTGDATALSDARIIWPDGQVQSLGSLPAGHRYEVPQNGELRSLPFEAERVSSVRAMSSPPASPTVASRRIVVDDPIRLQRFTLAKSANDLHSIEDEDSATLIAVWHSRSALSRTLLDRLAERADDIDAAGARIFASCGNPKEGEAVMRSLDLPFPVGWASRDDFFRLFVLRRAVVRGPEGEFTLPCSFLIDATGMLRVVYMGLPDPDQVVADVAAVQRGDEPAPTRPGRRLERVKRPADRVARWFQEMSLNEDARAYYMEQRQRHDQP